MTNRPTKCKAAFMHGPFDLRIQDLELPPLKPDQILIKVGACGICGSDVECYEGKSAEGRYDIAPYVPGHEWAGKAVEVGSAVTSVKVGDKVITSTSPSTEVKIDEDTVTIVRQSDILAIVE